MTVCRIPLTQAHVDQAHDDALAMHQSHNGRRSYTNLDRGVAGYFIGRVGETGFNEWMAYTPVPFTWHSEIVGSTLEASQVGHEFEIHLPDRDLTVEVKTAGQEFHQKCSYPAVQGQDFDILVGMRCVSNEWIDFMGWLGRKELADVLRHEEEGWETPSFVCDFAEMRDPRELNYLLTMLTSEVAPQH